MSENPQEQIWLHLSKWESQTLAHKLVTSRAERQGVPLSPEMATAKAQGLAYCLRNAREYLREPEATFNKRLFNGYYGLMALIGAILIADPATDYDLRKFEEATKMGHGLGNVDNPDQAFPEAQKVYLTEDGLLIRYLSHLGNNPRTLKVGRRFRETSELSTEEQERLLSLDSLLAGMPEIHEIYQEITGKTPVSTEIDWAPDLNPSAEPGGLLDAFEKQLGTDEHQHPYPGGVWLRIGGEKLLREEIARNHLKLPFSEYRVHTDEITGQTYLAGFFLCPEGEHWYDHMVIYQSVMTAKMFSRPLLGKVDDALAKHYVLMYALSIIVRYRPSLWREISEGKYDAYLALLKYNHEAFSRVVPQLALERVAAADVHVAQPGTWYAPM